MAARIDFRAPAVSGQTHNRHEITYSSEKHSRNTRINSAEDNFKKSNTAVLTRH